MEAEYTRALENCSAELETIKTRINKDQFDSIVQFLQRYAIIKACGTIEIVTKNLIADYVEQGSNTETQRYIDGKVRESSTNPKTTLIASVLGDFSPSWRQSFEEQLSSHGTEKTSLNSLVQLRNDFAHGKSPNTTIRTIIQYYEHAKIIVTILDNVLHGTEE